MPIKADRSFIFQRKDGVMKLKKGGTTRKIGWGMCGPLPKTVFMTKSAIFPTPLTN